MVQTLWDMIQPIIPIYYSFLFLLRSDDFGFSCGHLFRPSQFLYQEKGLYCYPEIVLGKINVTGSQGAWMQVETRQTPNTRLPCRIRSRRMVVMVGN